MIHVTLTTASGRETKVVDEASTIKDLFEQVGADTTFARVFIDGEFVPSNSLTRTFAEFGYGPDNDTCSVARVSKMGQ